LDTGRVRYPRSFAKDRTVREAMVIQSASGADVQFPQQAVSNFFFFHNDNNHIPPPYCEIPEGNKKDAYIAQLTTSSIIMMYMHNKCTTVGGELRYAYLVWRVSKSLPSNVPADLPEPARAESCRKGKLAKREMTHVFCSNDLLYTVSWLAPAYARLRVLCRRRRRR